MACDGNLTLKMFSGLHAKTARQCIGDMAEASHCDIVTSPFKRSLRQSRLSPRQKPQCVKELTGSHLLTLVSEDVWLHSVESSDDLKPCLQPITFHSIVGEALAELVDHNKTDADWVVGPAYCLNETEKGSQETDSEWFCTVDRPKQHRLAMIWHKSKTSYIMICIHILYECLRACMICFYYPKWPALQWSLSSYTPFLYWFNCL